MEIQAVFDNYIEQKPVFNNKDALTIRWVPGNIQHREDQIRSIALILAPSLRGEKPSNLFIYGKTGSGKSLVSLSVAEQLERASMNNGHHVKTVYVNCKMKRVADTEYRLIAYFLKELGKEVPFTGLPTQQVYNMFFETIDKLNQSVILIIDEIDALVKKAGDEILYNLTRINQSLKNSKLTVVGITNDLSFIEKLDPRIRSSLSEEELIFPPYNALQLQDILRQRSSVAFLGGFLEDGVIEKCSALAAQEHGDARKALDLLRVAAELAEREGSTKISLAYVDRAQEKIDQDRTLETVKMQPKQSQLVLFTITQLSEKTAEIETGKVFDYYHSLCGRYGMKSLTERRISDLIAELDLFGIINTKVVSKGRYGRTRVISLNLQDSIKKKLNNHFHQTFL